MRPRVPIKKILKRSVALGLISSFLLSQGCSTKITKRTRIYYNPKESILRKFEKPAQSDRIRPDLNTMMDSLKITNPKEREYFIDKLNELFKQKSKNGAISVYEFENMIKKVLDEMEKERKWRERRRILPENPVA